MSLDFSISSGDSQLCVFVYKRDRAEREREREAEVLCIHVEAEWWG